MSRGPRNLLVVLVASTDGGRPTAVRMSAISSA